MPLSVTVCIAAISNLGDFVVTLSDTMFANEERSVDSGRSKVAFLHDRWICMYAGDPSAFREVHPSISRGLDGTPSNVADVVAAVKSGYTKARMRRAESLVLHDCMMTYEDFLERGRSKLGDKVFERKLKEIGELQMGLDLLIAGLDDGPSDAHILSADPYGICTSHDDMGFHAIGSGAVAALAWLHVNDDFRNEGYVVPIAHRLLEAKYCAETSGFVGKKSMTLLP
jgi:hypothetical protein